MRKNWLYALPLALAALHPAGAEAAGRGQENGLVAAAGAESTDSGYGTYVYSDVQKPHGRERGDAAEQTATQLCDGGDTDKIATAGFNACMSARGWSFDHYEPLAPNTYIYADTLKPHGVDRSEAARQSATRLCDRGDSDNIGLPAFDSCMSAHGWRYVAQTPPAEDSGSDDSTPVSDSSSSGPDPAMQAIDSANQQAATDAANAAAQQQFTDGILAAQQQMNQAVFVQQ